MDITRFYDIEGEKPLDNLVTNGGYCGIFRTIVCIGDSLSSGELESFENGEIGYHDFYEYSWGQFMARDIGCKVYNCSKGGLTAKTYLEDFAEDRGFFGDEYKAQAYIIALGVNDASRIMDKEMEFGSLEDINLEDYTKNADTFVGNYAKLVCRYKEMQPKAKFFFITPPHNGKNDERVMIYDKMQEVLYKLAEMLDYCYVIDLRKYSPVNNEEYKKRFYLGKHLNPMGYRFVALMIESYIDYIIRHNFEHFKQVGFIGQPFCDEREIW